MIKTGINTGLINYLILVNILLFISSNSNCMFWGKLRKDLPHNVTKLTNKNFSGLIKKNQKRLYGQDSPDDFCYCDEPRAKILDFFVYTVMNIGIFELGKWIGKEELKEKLQLIQEDQKNKKLN